MIILALVSAQIMEFIHYATFPNLFQAKVCL